LLVRKRLGMIALTSPAGMIAFLAGLLSMLGVAIAAVVISFNRKKHGPVENE
jgi:hypothetical protein